MRALNQRAARVMRELIAGLDAVGDHRKLDYTPGIHMAVCVERVGEQLFSVAHYYEQNGDLMADPEMTFWRGPNGEFYPASYRNDGVGVNRESIIFDDAGKPKRFVPKEQRDEASFAAMWMSNIRDQQLRHATEAGRA